MKKTIKAKVSDAINNSKEEILEKEWNKWEDLKKEVKKCEEEDFLSLLDNKYQFFKTDERHASYVSHAINQLKSYNEPLPLRNDCFDIQRRNTELVPFWASIPTRERRGGVKVPLEVPYRYYDTLDEWEIQDSQLIKKGDEFWVHINLEKEIETEKEYDGILAIDLGIKHPAVGVAVGCSSVKPEFYGDRIKKIRGKYFYLRRKLQLLGHEEALEKISDKEKRKIDDRVHKVSRKIVDKAEEYNLCIVIGDIKNHRNSDWGKKGNRKLHSMVSNKLKEYIKYKAEGEGIKVLEVDESYTTKTCSRCGHRRKSRPDKQFKCPKCDYQTHSDINGAKNIGERGLNKLRDTSIQVRGFIDQPEPLKDT